MGTYKFVEHTADEKFIARGDSLSDAFSTCVLAFCEVIVPKQTVKKNFSKMVKVKAKRLRSLLYDFLNELVFYYDDEDLILQHVKELRLRESNEGWELECIVEGDKHYSYDVEMEIKNMTYSDMEIWQDEEFVEITVVVDI